MKMTGGVLAALVLAGCGHAQMVERSENGGTLTLTGGALGRGKAMEDAQQKMAAHCAPRPYRITKEANVQSGGATATTTTEKNVFTGKDETVTKTAAAREYQITYECAK